MIYKISVKTMQRGERFNITADVIKRIVLFLLLLLWVNETVFSENQQVLNSRFHAIFYEKMGDQLYNTKELPGSLIKAIATYKKAAKYSHAETDIYWKITRCYWVLATKQTEDPKKRNELYKKGIHYGELAVSKDSNNSNNYLWYALIIGSHSVDQGVMNTIYMRNRIKENLETSIRLNPKNSNAILGLSAWYFHVPGFFGGDKKKAFELIDHAIKIDPYYSAVLMQKSEFLIQMEEFQNAADTLKKLMQMTKCKFKNDTREDKARAKLMLKALEKKKIM